MKNASTIKVYKDCLAIGIDVSKADLAIVRITVKESYLSTVNNQQKAIRSFMRHLKHCGFKGKIICESTGHYHVKLALICH